MTFKLVRTVRERLELPMRNHPEVNPFLELEDAVDHVRDIINDRKLDPKHVSWFIHYPVGTASPPPKLIIDFIDQRLEVESE